MALSNLATTDTNAGVAARRAWELARETVLNHPDIGEGTPTIR